MNNERKKILEILASSKISVEEAEKLLEALGGADESAAPKAKAPPKMPTYFHVRVESKPGVAKKNSVNVRVPFKLVRAGMKLASLIPLDVQGKVNVAMKEKGIEIDIGKITPENLDEVLMTLADFEVNVDNDEENVRVYCE